MLDIDNFRDKEEGQPGIGPDVVRANLTKKGMSTEPVDRVRELDAKWREYQFNFDELNKQKNMVSRAFGERMKAKEKLDDNDTVPDSIKENIMSIKKDDLAPLVARQIKAIVPLLEKMMVENNEARDAAEEARNKILHSIPNLCPPSVPAGNDEDTCNTTERTVGDVEYRKKYSHVDLIEMIDGVDMARGSFTAGNRGYYLQGPAVCLEQALVAFATRSMMGHGFVPISPPVFMQKKAMQEVAQLEQFDEELYKVTGKGSENPEDKTVKENYLIATSEQPIAAYHRDEWMAKDSLPKKYLGISECFRQEVGSHGRDTGGIFRVHQFKKVEQFVITAPEESWDAHTMMITAAENFCKEIGLSYRIVNICAGKLNNAAAKKLDLEAWFPGSGAYRELVSCSNCTDYQSRRLKIRFGATKEKGKGPQKFVHMLNSTVCATTRMICVILETFQHHDEEPGKSGVIVPEALRPYMPPQYENFIPFVKRAPIDVEREAAEKAASKKKGKGKKK